MTYVKKDAVLMCTGCPGVPAFLETKSARTVKLEDGIIGVETDKKIAEPGFVTCLAVPTTPRKCSPKLGSWSRVKSDTLSKGDAQLLFPNTIPCAFGPGMVSMTYAGQVLSRDDASAAKPGEKKCKWNKCDEKHDFDIFYPDDGVVTRKGLSIWSHPSALVVQGFHTPIYKAPGDCTDYKYQRHHVIPCKVFELKPIISANLKLLGFDINNEGLNGISLPSKYTDVIWQDLQFHSGSHPRYNDKVETALDDLESQCQEFCKNNEQIKLWDLIAEKVNKYRDILLKWKFPLHSTSYARRTEAFAKIGIIVPLKTIKQ
jgi:hypothetical protein